MGRSMEEVRDKYKELPLESSKFWKVLGVWLGLGKLRRNRVEWVIEESHSESYISMVDDIGEKLEKEVKTIIKGKSTILSIKSKELASFIEDSFLRGIKEIPSYLVELDIELVQSFIKGYWLVEGRLNDKDKDYLDDDCDRYIYFKTVEVGVLQGLRDMLAGHGVVSILQEDEDEIYTLKFTGKYTSKLNRFILGTFKGGTRVDKG